MFDTLKQTHNPYLESFISIFIFLIFSLGAQAQKTEKHFEKADNYFRIQKYEKAIKCFNKIIDAGEFDEKTYLQCARCYERIEEYSKADELFSQIIFKSDKVEPEIFLEYGDLLMKLGRNDEARSYFMSYNNLMENNDLRVLRNIKSIEDIDKYYQDTAFIQIELLALSSEAEDYNPREHGNHIYYESNKDYISSDPVFRSLYVQSAADRYSDKSRKISGSDNSKQILNGFAVASSTSEVFMAINEAFGSEERSRLRRSFLDDSGVKLSKEEEVSVGSFKGNIFFPAVNKTGQILVFASDTKSGAGGLDLYISYRDAYGYGDPVLLDGFVNTTGNENYPFLVHDTVLFFASDGHGGLGGYDVYYADLNTPHSIPVNLGSPINSQYDDFGLSLSEDNTTGYLSSNRAREKTRADVYRFELARVRAIGEVTDEVTGNNLKNVAVSYSKPGEEKSQITLADNGWFSLVGQPGDEYNLTIWREGYEMEEFYVSTASANAVGLYEVNIGKFPILKMEQEVMPLPVEITEELVEEPMEDTLFVEEVIEEPIEEPVEELSAPTTGIVFRVQIAASRIPMDEADLRRIYKGQRDFFMFGEDKWFKYAIGEFNSYYEANAVRKHCGVPGAFVAAYSNNSKLELMSAIRELHAKPAELKSKSVEISDSREIVSSTTIYFPFDHYQPDANELKKMDELFDLLNSNDNYRVEVDGHTDIQGSTDYNYGLGSERAKCIKNYLVDKGINPERILVLSYGENKLRKFCHQNCTPMIHRQNRRTEIIVFKK